MNSIFNTRSLMAFVAALCVGFLGAGSAEAGVPGATRMLVDFEPSTIEKCDLGPVKTPMIVDPGVVVSPKANVFDRLAVCVLSGEPLGRQLIIAPEYVNTEDMMLATTMSLWMTSLGLSDEHFDVLASNKVLPEPAVQTRYAARRVSMRIIDTDTTTGNGEMVIKMGERLVDFCELRQFNVFFDTGSASLAREARQELNRVAACMRRGELASEDLIIMGHASPLGDQDANRILSESRALSVSVYLIGAGVPSTSMSTLAFGEVTERDYLAPDAERRVDIVVAGR